MCDPESARWLLRQRLCALAREIRHWKTRSRRGGPPCFWTNHSQVRAFAGIIQNISAAIHSAMKETAFSAADAHAHAKDVLALFRIWEFFRSKLAQRLDERYAAFLQLADEFAWACYQPAAAIAFKEPPLIFLNGGFSPFILPRRHEFQAEFVPRELIQDDALKQAMSQLPFPVIGVPWYQVAAPWELPVISHEVGHSMEVDLGLTGELENRIRRVIPDPKRAVRWLGWCSEIFADYYGCRAVGPSFVSNLADFLSGVANGGEQDDYPPVGVRFRLNLAFLGKDFDGPAKELEARWKLLLKVPDGYGEYADTDAPLIAESFRTMDLGLRAFSPADHDNASGLADAALSQRAIYGVPEVRVITAALRIAYDEIVLEVDAAQIRKFMRRLDKLVALFHQSAKPDIRAGAARTGPDQAAREAAQKRRAQDWLRRIRSVTAE